MMIHSKTLPISVRSSVTPIDNPTVPKAEKTSNASGNTGIVSVMANTNKELKIIIMLTVAIANDRKIISNFIVLPKTWGSRMALK